MKSILVVDDDEDLLEMTALMLRIQKYEVRTLDRGSALLEEVAMARPDVIVLDIYLGDSDGRDLCRQLKNDPKHWGIPVLLYSAVGTSQQSIEDSRADGFLQKPFNMQELTSRLKELSGE